MPSPPPPPPPAAAPPPPPPPSDAPPPAPPPPPSEPAPPPPPSAPAPTEPPPIPPVEDLEFDISDIDSILASEASLLTREQEVLRIIGCFKLNPYEILDLNFMPSAAITDSDIQRSYRKKSLLIHPDKLKHERGIEAFDLLKKAQVELTDEKKRKNLDQTVEDARMLVLRELKLLPVVEDSHPTLAALKDPDLKERVRKKTKEILIDDELRRRRVQKMTMIAEGAEAKRVEEAVEERKRKMEEKQRWEETREERVSDWRSFQKGGKKKKQKTNVLG